MQHRLLRAITAGVLAGAFFAPASVAAAHAPPSSETGGLSRVALAVDLAAEPPAWGEHGVRACLDGRSNPTLDSPLALNMVANCSFESNDFTSAARSWEWFGAGGTSHLATEILSGGRQNSYALIDAGAIDNHIWQVVPTVPGRMYVVSAHVRVGTDDGHTPAAVFLTAKGQKPDGTQNQASTTQLTIAELADATEWTEKTFTFTAANWRTYVGSVKWASDDREGHAANTTIAMDNLVVYEQESYELVWNDEFDGDALDQQTWGYELGNVRGNEQQHYSSGTDNVDVNNGELVLAVTDRPTADQYRNTARWGENARTVMYNSGSVRTEGRAEFLYGRVEARMTLPKGKGVFPAFWMLGADFHMDGRVNMEHGYSWPSTGELDIMEIIGAPTVERTAQGEVGKPGNSNAVAYGTPHFYYGNGNPNPDRDGSYAPTALGKSLTAPADFSERAHVFGIDWNPDYIAWHVDGVVYNVMYFPTADTTRAGNEAFVASELARFQAAADSLNRPQYVQLNLATGGNWAGDAGAHLAEDGAQLEVDWVRYYRSAAQQAAADAYYADQPAITATEAQALGVGEATDRVMRAGEATDLLAGLSTDAGYRLEYSVNDEQMFVNGGVPDGRNEVRLRVTGASDTAALQSLEPGVYSLHYSALADGSVYSGAITPEARVVRQTVLLTVLPESGLSGVEGETLATVALPTGWSWLDNTQEVTAGSSYPVIFTQAADTVTDPADRRAVQVEVPVEVQQQPADGAEGDDGVGESDGGGAGVIPEGMGIDSAAAATRGDALASTGADIAPFAAAALALLVLGSILTIVRRGSARAS